MGTQNLGLLSNNPVRGKFRKVNRGKDTFKFTLNETRNVDLLLRNTRSGRDADVRLYKDTNGNGKLDKLDLLVASDIRTGANELINVALNAGTYFAQVSRNPNVRGTARYTLDVHPSGFVQDLIGSDGLLGTLTTDLTRFGSINDANTSDVYVFTLGDFTGVNLFLSGFNGDVDMRLYYDRNRDRVFSKDELIRSASGFGSSHSLGWNEDSGNYLMQVYRGSGNTNYQVNLDSYTTPYW